MSGFHSQAMGHLVRRGVMAVQSVSASEEHIEALNHQAQLYEESPYGSVQPWELLVILFTGLAFLALYASAKYTLTEVVASLVAVEQPRTVILTESKPDESADPDSPLEKAPLLDEEIMVLKEEPITRSIPKTVRHLTNMGGFRARWRGLGVSIVYHIAHSFYMHFICTLFFGAQPNAMNPIPFSVAWIISGVSLARIHAGWTQVMISRPNALPWFKRIPGSSAHKALLLPSFVYAVAQLAVFVIPAMIALPAIESYAAGTPIEGDAPKFASSMLGAFAAALLIGVSFVLPASVTLTRIEASLLPEDQETVVNFDRMLGGAAISAEGEATRSDYVALFFGAWKSFDRASRSRLITFYVKMTMALLFILIAGALTVWNEILLFGPDRLRAFVLAGSAQLQLMHAGQ